MWDGWRPRHLGIFMVSWLLHLLLPYWLTLCCCSWACADLLDC